MSVKKKWQSSKSDKTQIDMNIENNLLTVQDFLALEITFYAVKK